MSGTMKIGTHTAYKYGTDTRRNLERGSAEGSQFSEVLQSTMKQDESQQPRQNKAALMEAARELEALFAHQLVKAMRQTVPESQGMFARSNAEKVWQDMLDEELAGILAETKSLGLAEMIYQQLAGHVADDQDPESRK